MGRALNLIFLEKGNSIGYCLIKYCLKRDFCHSSHGNKLNMKSNEFKGENVLWSNVRECCLSIPLDLKFFSVCGYGDDSFSTFAIFSETLTFLSRMSTSCVY